MPATIISANNYLPVPAGAKYYTLKDDAVACSLNGALSFSFIDRIVSRGRNFRNLIDAGVAGGSWDATDIGQFVSAADDRVNDVDPRDEQITKTYMIFWSGATGSGNVVAMVPEALFEQFSPDIPTRY